jgi:hypothetical protein
MAIEKFIVFLILLSIFVVCIKYIILPLLKTILEPYLLILKAKQETRVANVKLKILKEEVSVLRKNTESHRILDELINEEEINESKTKL